MTTDAGRELLASVFGVLPVTDARVIDDVIFPRYAGGLDGLTRDLAVEDLRFLEAALQRMAPAGRPGVLQRAREVLFAFFPRNCSNSFIAKLAVEGLLIF